MAAFCLSLCGLGVSAGVQMRAQVTGRPPIDDGTLGFVSTFFRTIAFQGAFDNDVTFVVRTASSTGIAPTAMWNFFDLEPGTYSVYQTWPVYRVAVENAVVTVDRTSVASNTTVSTTINQRMAPSSITMYNRGWQLLATMNVDETSRITVTMTAGVGVNMADAVLVRKEVRINPPTDQPYCGNAIVEAPETCDDGNNSALDSCYRCTITVCGDNFVQTGSQRSEQCDFGDKNGTQLDGPLPANACDKVTCKELTCGDGVLTQWIGEECDGGASCTRDCKTVVVKTACNDGVDNDADGTIDMNDKGCANAQDPNEGDGATDLTISLSTIIQGGLQPGAGTSPVLSVTNKGPDTANDGMKVTINIPDGMTYDAANTQDGCLSIDGMITCKLGKIAVGQTVTLKIGYSSKPDNMCKPPMMFIARISESSQGDPNPADNEAKSSMEVSCSTATEAVTLKNIVISCRDNKDVVTVHYSKNFATCVHMKTPGNINYGTQNYFCNNSGPILVEAANLMNVASGMITVGSPVKLCHGNNGNVCSSLVPVTGTTCTVIKTGNLFVTLDSTPTRSRQLLGGTLGDTALRLQLRAENEAVAISTLRIVAVGPNTSGIDRLELFRDGTSTAFATATTAGCGGIFVNSWNALPASTLCATIPNNQLIVQNSQNLDIIVRPRIKSDEQGAVSGQPIQFVLPSAGSAGQPLAMFSFVEAQGMTSNNVLTVNDDDGLLEGEVFIGRTDAGPSIDIQGNRNVIVLSKITSITNANSDPDNMNVPTGISPIGQFKFTAATNNNTLNGLNNVVLRRLVFNITTTNVSFDATSLKFYNKADSSMKKSCTVMGGGTTGGIGGGTVTSQYFVECTVLDTSGVDVQLDSGESSTFVLEANVSPGPSSASIRVFLDNFTNANTPGGNILWQDKDSAFFPQRFQWVEYSDTIVNSTLYRS